MRAKAGVSLAAALFTACRLARSAREVQSDHLLLALCRASLGMRSSLGPELRRLRRLQRVRDRHAAHRPRGYPPDAMTGAPAGPRLAVDTALLEARWEACRTGRSGRPLSRAPLWSAEAQSVVRRALATATDSGVEFAGGGFAFDACLTAARSRAIDLLDQGGISGSDLRAAADGDGSLQYGDVRPTPTVQALVTFEMAEGPAELVAIPAGLSRYMLRRIEIDPMAFLLELDTIRQAVRLGNGWVEPVHMLLAALDLDEELAATGVQLPGPYAAANSGGRALRVAGLSWEQLANWVAGNLDPGQPELVASYRPLWWRRRRARAWRSHYQNPPWRMSAAAAADRALAMAAERRRPGGTTHLVVAALADPGNTAVGMLESLGIDPAGVSRALVTSD